VEHRLLTLLNDAAEGRFPEPDFAVEVLPSSPGRLDGVVAFSAHNVIATDVPEDEVRAALPSDDPGAPMDARFLSWLSSRLGVPPGVVDLVLVAPSKVEAREVELVERDDAGDHPRVVRATAYRTDVRVFSEPAGAGVAILGRGLAGRLEVAVEVDDGARSRGLGRALATAVIPFAGGEPVFAQVSPGNVASVRAFLAAGYRPICSECLFLRDVFGGVDAGP
jgi:GNAT superfamily N-acetyltransferase